MDISGIVGRAGQKAGVVSLDRQSCCHIGNRFRLKDSAGIRFDAGDATASGIVAGMGLAENSIEPPTGEERPWPPKLRRKERTVWLWSLACRFEEKVCTSGGFYLSPRASSTWLSKATTSLRIPGWSMGSIRRSASSRIRRWCSGQFGNPATLPSSPS